MWRASWISVDCAERDAADDAIVQVDVSPVASVSAAETLLKFPQEPTTTIPPGCSKLTTRHYVISYRFSLS